MNTTTRTLVVERELPYSPEKIWRALTQGPLLQEWLMDNDFQPLVGHKFTFRQTPQPNWDGIIESVVLEVEPPQKLSYSWDALGLVSIVVWTLDATDAGTLLRMEQSGFRADQDHAYRGANYGWQKFFVGLERVVAGLN